MVLEEVMAQSVLGVDSMRLVNSGWEEQLKAMAKGSYISYNRYIFSYVTGLTLVEDTVCIGRFGLAGFGGATDVGGAGSLSRSRSSSSSSSSS